MIQDIKSQKEVKLLIIVFIVIGILSIAVKSFEFYNIKIISDTTKDIYEHPLKVSNASLNINLDIYKMHRDMKDIVLSSSDKELLALVEEVNKHEKRVYKNFDAIENNILGNDGLKLEKKTRELFAKWKPIREEVISLVKNAKYNDAIAITKGKGAKHVLKLEVAALELYDYAQNKAIGFKNKSESSFKILETINIIISLLFFFLFILIGYYVVHRISKHITKNEHLNGVLSVIRDVNQLIIREKDPQLLIQESCKILTSTHVYDNAWIVTYDENNKIEHIASTYPTEKFISFKNMFDENWIPHCINKTITGDNEYSFIVSTKKSCKECPLRAEYNNESAFNIELRHQERLYGYLTLSLDPIYINDKDELALLDEVAGDIAYALYNLEIEQNLIKQEERYRYVIEATNDGLWDWNLVTNGMYYSPRWKSMLGYSDDELDNVLETWQKLVHPDDIEKVTLDISLSHKNKTQYYRNIHRLKHKDGHWVWIEDRGKTLFDENSKPVRMIGTHIDISEQRKLQEEILQSNRMLNNIAGNVPGVVCTFQAFPDGRSCFPFASENIYDIYGVRPEEVKEDTAKAVSAIHPEDFEEWAKSVQVSFEELTLWEEEFRIIHPDKGLIWVKGMALPEKQVDGSVLWYGYIYDISKEKASQRELNEAQSIAKVGSWSLDINKDILTWSDETYHIFNIDKEVPITHDRFLSLVHPEDSELLNQAWDRALDGEAYNIEHRIIVKDKIKWINEKVKIEFDKDGEPLQAFGTAQDITERKDIESTLRTEKIRYEKAEEIGKVGSWAYFVDTEEFWASSESKRIYGFPKDSDLFAIQTVEGCIPERERVHQALVDLLEKGAEYKLEFEVNPFDGGDTKTISSIAEVEHNESGHPIKVFGFIQDITELKHKDEMLIAQSRSAAMGEMIGMIAHQWRQPLTVISMNVNNMLLDIELDELGMNNVKEYSGDIVKQIEHLSKTIDDFRNFFQPDKSILKVKLQDVLEETNSIVKDSLTNNNITLDMSFDSESEVDAYPRELMQVFVNIINNAKDSLLQKKSTNLNIDIKVFEDKEYVITQICDNGVGIDEAILLKIFDPYFTTKDTKNGTGLGLYMSKMIIEDHLHGKIEAYHNDEGACFRVKLLK